MEHIYYLYHHEPFMNSFSYLPFFYHEKKFLYGFVLV